MRVGVAEGAEGGGSVVLGGADGNIHLYNNAGTVDLVIDIVGYYSSTGATYTTTTPTRILDSRAGQNPTTEAQNSTITTWGPAEEKTVDVTGIAGVPTTGITAVAIHITSVNPSAPSFLSAGPNPVDQTNPTAAKNYGPTALGPFGHAGLTNDVLIVPVGADGNIRLYNNAGTVDLVIDIIGYYS